MMRPLTPTIGRRHLLRGLTAAAAMPALLTTQPALAAQSPLPLTPAQTEGPFYPTDWLGDIDNDLVQVQGEAAHALGKITHVVGRILDAAGHPIAGAQVEIWQCDANGKYRHPRDRSWFSNAKRDPGFQGRGRMLSGDAGAYAFRTIRPVAYPGRTPHIHFAITTPGREPLITQMYVAGEAANERDGILQGIRDEAQRRSVIIALEPADRLEPGALAANFDIVLG